MPAQSLACVLSSDDGTDASTTGQQGIRQQPGDLLSCPAWKWPACLTFPKGSPVMLAGLVAAAELNGPQFVFAKSTGEPNQHTSVVLYEPVC